MKTQVNKVRIFTDGVANRAYVLFPPNDRRIALMVAVMKGNGMSAISIGYTPTSRYDGIPLVNELTAMLHPMTLTREQIGSAIEQQINVWLDHLDEVCIGMEFLAAP